ncbi:hypothetical protein [Desulfohalovibrio reitneri]|uniref:hypothetical protein n=1 Tax=Desulfohalovibrio reitneri TaxID=1307759 RepID=UPI0004A6B9A9|nr:hypothetical protein [Desulfohalovibrio reitneri]
MPKDFLLDELTTIGLAAQPSETPPDPADYSIIRIQRDPSLEPQADAQDLNEYEGDGAASPQSLLMKRWNASLSVLARGGGVDVDSKPLLPDYAPLLLCCGMRQADVLIIPVDAVTGFTPGGVVTGGTSGGEGTVVCVDHDSLVVTVSMDGFADGEAIDQTDPSATANITGAPMPGKLLRPKTDDSAHEHAAVQLYKDRILREVLSLACSFNLDAQVGNRPVFSMEGQGLYSGPVDAPFGDIPAVPTAPPKVESIGLRIGDRLDATGPWLPPNTGVRFSQGGRVESIRDANSANGFRGFSVVGREATVEMTLYACTLDIFNPFAIWNAETPVPVSYTIGSTAGNRLRMIIPAMQISSVSDSSEAGKVTWSISGRCTRGALEDSEFGLIYF